MCRNKNIYRRRGNIIRTLVSLLLAAVMVAADITPVLALEAAEPIAPAEQDEGAVPELAGASLEEEVLYEDRNSVVKDDEKVIPVLADEGLSDGASDTLQEVGDDAPADAVSDKEIVVIGGLIQNGEFPEEVKTDEDQHGIAAEGTAEEALAGAINTIVSAARNWNGKDESLEVDISSYNIPMGDHVRLSSAINLSPELFYVESMYYYQSGDTVPRIGLRFNKNYSLNDITTFNNKADAILSGVDTQWTDAQKLIYIHDYLTSHIDYTYEKYNAYNALVEGKCVCQGYALAYAYLMNRIDKDYDCTVVTSDINKHAWNLVTLGGRKYYVDVTGDDPTNQYKFFNRYTNCLLSKDKIAGTTNHKGSDWVDAYGYSVYNTATGNAYDDAAWKGMYSTMPMFGTSGVYYSGYGSEGMNIYRYDFAKGEAGFVKNYPDVYWHTWGSATGYWQGNYSHIAAAGSNLLVTLPDKIYVIDQSGKDVTSYDNKGAGKGYIYGGQLNGNTFSYDVYTNPPSGSGSQYIGRYTQTVDTPVPTVPVSSVTLDKSSVKMTTGGTATLTATVLPANATDKSVTWTSSDANTVTVSNGALTARKAGTATITVTSAADPTKKAQCTVTVTDAVVPVTGVTVAPASLQLQLVTGKVVTGSLVATVLPANATDKTVTWTSGNTGIATVDSDGTVIARSAGTVIIKATTKDGGKTATCTVTVKAAQDPDDPGDDPKLKVEITESFIYDGSAKTPNPEVYYGKKKLVLGKDYTLAYKNNTNATDNATVTVKFTGNYEGSITGTFKIGKADIRNARINSPVAYVKYKEKGGVRQYTVQKLMPSVIYGGKALKNNTDFTAEYPDTSADAYAKGGKYRVKITGKGNYTGSTEVNEELKENTQEEIIDLKKVTITPEKAVKSYAYTGNAIEPKYILKYKDRELKSGTDYVTVYSNNVNAGTATVSFVAGGNGNISGAASKTFKIDKVSFKTSAPRIVIRNGNSYPYSKTGVTPEVTVYWNGRELAEGTDYKISYKNNKNVSTDKKKAEAVVSGAGNFKDSCSGLFEITKQNIGSGKLVIEDPAFVNKADAYKKAKIYVYDSNGTALGSSDYSITGWKINGIDAGKDKLIAGVGDVVEVTVEGKGSYSGRLTAGAKVYNTAESYDLSKANVSFRVGSGATYNTAKKAFEYRGKPVCPNESNLVLSITSGSGKNKKTVILADDDYVILNYESNLNKGTARMTIRGNSKKCKGIKVVSYKIISTK